VCVTSSVVDRYGGQPCHFVTLTLGSKPARDSQCPWLLPSPTCDDVLDSALERWAPIADTRNPTLLRARARGLRHDAAAGKGRRINTRHGEQGHEAATAADQGGAAQGDWRLWAWSGRAGPRARCPAAAHTHRRLDRPVPHPRCVRTLPLSQTSPELFNKLLLGDDVSTARSTAPAASTQQQAAGKHGARTAAATGSSAARAAASRAAGHLGPPAGQTNSTHGFSGGDEPVSVIQQLALELESVKRERHQLLASLQQVKAAAGASARHARTHGTHACWAPPACHARRRPRCLLQPAQPAPRCRRRPSLHGARASWQRVLTLLRRPTRASAC
jgi:hypothetical protein